MRKNLWLIFGIMLSSGVFAEDLTNAPAASAIQAPAPAEAAAPTNAAPVKPKSTAPKTKKKSVAPKRIVQPELRTVPLVPGPATVVASNVNVRGQATLKGEVLSRLTKGDQVTVIEEVLLKRSDVDEPSAWAKIILPPSVHAYVNASFINQADGTVTARRLNMRGGPGENYSVLGRLVRGDVVKVNTSKDGWLQIESPTNAFAFVAAQYLKQEAPPVVAANTSSTPPDTSTTPQDTTPAAVPDAPTITTASTDISVPPSTTNAVPEVAATDSASISNAVAVSEPEPEEPPPPRIVQREGVVRGTVSIQAPSKYELWSPESGQIINYLHTTSSQLDLSRYKGLRIIITGEESLDERWRTTPVITIQKITVAD